METPSQTITINNGPMGSEGVLYRADITARVLKANVMNATESDLDFIDRTVAAIKGFLGARTEEWIREYEAAMTGLAHHACADRPDNAALKCAEFISGVGAFVRAHESLDPSFAASFRALVEEGERRTFTVDPDFANRLAAEFWYLALLGKARYEQHASRKAALEREWADLEKRYATRVC